MTWLIYVLSPPESLEDMFFIDEAEPRTLIKKLWLIIKLKIFPKRTLQTAYSELEKDLPNPTGIITLNI